MGQVLALPSAICSLPGSIPAGIYRSVLPECQALPWLDPCTQPRQTHTSTGGQVCALTLPDGLCVGSLACMSCQGLAFVHAPSLGRGQWGGWNSVLSGPAEPRRERVHGWPLTNKHEAHAGCQPVPVLSLGRMTQGSRQPRRAPVSLQPGLGPSALPTSTLRPRPSQDQIWPLSFCLAAPFQGIKASVSGNTDSSGDPRGQLWEVGQGSRHFSPAAATFLHHLPGARAPQHSEVPGATEEASVLLGRGGNRVE